MSQTAGNWHDLKTRLITGILLAMVGIGAVWAGGIWFVALLIVATGAMIWELSFITRADDGPMPVLFGMAAALALLIYSQFPQVSPYSGVGGMLLVFAYASRRLQMCGTAYFGVIFLAVITMISLRSGQGALWVLWLVLVVVASDIAGYLAGRLFGGPKFWPSISPKKTWSGTVAGWIGAAIVGAVMAPKLGVGYSLILISTILAFAGQMGDIAQSALKRVAGIKDSSNLLPGHGGVLDRLDALIGASVVLLAIIAIGGLPS